MITAGSTLQLRSPEDQVPGSSHAERDAYSQGKDLQALAGRGDVPPERVVAFGPFHLLPARRLLLVADEPVRLGSRALEILIALVERPGELLRKDELMARVWPNTFVEEGNLKVQIAGLRRALRDGRGSNRYVVTIPGRGYRFVAPVTFWEAPATQPEAAERAHNLPAPVTRLVGRTDMVAALKDRLPRERFITIVGPGGVGKTSIALAVARALIDRYQHGIRFVGLAPLADPCLVPGALAAALNLEIRSDDPIPNLIAALSVKEMLLVLDNCAHLIEAAAALAVEVLNRAPAVQILATSREPLRAEGEHVHRLPSLECPSTSSRLTAAEALGFPAVQLFVERAAAILGRFELSDEDAPIVANICRKLDGLPMAIEFAAGRVDALGLRELAVHLPDRLQLLTNGRRPTLPRHHSLRASLEWSHVLLPERERKVLQRLAIFAEGFTLAAASAVAASAEITAADVLECLADLVAKSLVVAKVGGPVPCYRLFETTRVYALEKLTDSGEVEDVEHRYAEYLRGLGQRIEVGRDSPPAPGRLSTPHSSAHRSTVRSPHGSGPRVHHNKPLLRTAKRGAVSNRPR
jgi:predicted ATPase/DNA-binding winged helix-turn-helix (wHTH) protein